MDIGGLFDDDYAQHNVSEFDHVGRPVAIEYESENLHFDGRFYNPVYDNAMNIPDHEWE